MERMIRIADEKGPLKLSVEFTAYGIQDNTVNGQ